MILIIGEKPSIAKKIVGGLGLKEKFEYRKGYYISDNYIVTNCVGHLLREKFPKEIDEKYKVWSFDTLPFYPNPIPLAKSESTLDQINIVEKLLSRKDVVEICNACDADREGELIFRNLITFFKPSCKNLSRMWIESVATNEIMLETFENRKSESLYEGLYEAALARSYLDYYIGINGTIAMSLKYGGGKSISLGRVITPTLKIITDLEDKIKNFKSEKFYKIVADTNIHPDFNYYNEDLEDNRFNKKSEAEAVIKRVGVGSAKVLEFKKKIEKEKPPKLYSLSDLQIALSSKYGYTAQEVLESVQELYEKYGLVTYPRTSENHISPEMAKISNAIVECLGSVFTTEVETIREKNYTIDRQVVSKKEIASHEALTPTQKKLTTVVYDALPSKLKNTYDEIVTRFLMNFYPQAEYDVCEISISRNGEIFKKKFKNLIVEGFYELTDKRKCEPLNLDETDSIEITSLNIVEGKTEAPKRLTEGSLIKIMQSPLKYASCKDSKESLKESGGIGTEATRASIIESLKKNEFITIKKNSIFATEKGTELIKIIPNERIKSVDFTASLETSLGKIKDNKLRKEELLESVKQETDELIKEIKGGEDIQLANKNEICKCPVCGSSIVANKYGFGCSNYNNCKVNIFKDTSVKFGASRNITEKQAKELFLKGETSAKLKFKSKRTGKEFEAKLSYTYNKNAKYPNDLKLKFD